MGNTVHPNRMFNRNRLVSKDGNLSQDVYDKAYSSRRKSERWSLNLHSYIVSASWLFILLLISLAYISSWIFFAMLWYGLSFRNGDFQENNEPNHVPCVLNVGNSFFAFFLFSLETQSTIGFGHYQPSSKCFGSLLISAAQASVGVLISVFAAGIVLNKILGPKEGQRLIGFSQRAVVGHRDGELCLMIGIYPMNPAKFMIVDTSVQLIHLETRIEKDHCVPILCRELTIKNEAHRSGVLLVCPMIIEHVINPRSPLFRYLPHNRKQPETFELITIVEGIIECTGIPCHYRTSYLPHEILWGYHFKSPKYTPTPSESDAVLVKEFKMDKVASQDDPLVSMINLNGVRERTYSDWNDIRSLRKSSTKEHELQKSNSLNYRKKRKI